MDCPLLNYVYIKPVKAKKLLLKSGAWAKSTDERIPKDLMFETLSTNDSDNFNNEGGSPLRSSKSSRNSRLEMSVEEHPLYANMNDRQAATYDAFVMQCNREFGKFYWTDKAIRKMCLDEINLLRFLKARSFNINKAMKMWKKWVDWRMEYNFPKKEDVINEPVKKFFKIVKHDKNNNPLVVIKPGAFDGHIDPETILRVWIYTIEKACRKSDKQSYGALSVIFDREGLTQSKDRKWFPVYKIMGQTLQDYYPERLHTAYIVNANWFTKIIISMCKVFLSKDTRSKICTIKKHSDLLRYVDEQNIPRQYRN